MNHLHVVIATHGRGELLARTLATVAECRRPDGYRGVIVVENGGRGDAERVVAEAPAALDAQYLFEPMGNKCRALNAALAARAAMVMAAVRMVVMIGSMGMRVDLGLCRQMLGSACPAMQPFLASHPERTIRACHA